MFVDANFNVGHLFIPLFLYFPVILKESSKYAGLSLCICLQVEFYNNILILHHIKCKDRGF